MKLKWRLKSAVEHTMIPSARHDGIRSTFEFAFHHVFLGVWVLAFGYYCIAKWQEGDSTMTEQQ
jgi:hypothetical protein